VIGTGKKRGSESKRKSGITEVDGQTKGEKTRKRENKARE